MKTKIVLEMCCNHQGDINIATKMIDDAKRLGAWAVKFQKRELSLIPENIKNNPRNNGNSFGKTYFEHRKALEFSMAEIEYLKNYAHSLDLFFACTAFDVESAKKLKKINVDFIKLPSQLYLDIEMFQELCWDNKKVIVSTGMHNEKEIVSGPWFEKAACVMHCISLYPGHPVEMQLSTITRLKKLRNFSVGYSSHENNGLACSPAVFCGADVIERHYTLDKTMKGSDHKISSDCNEMWRIVEEIKTVEKMLGGSERIVTEEEMEISKKYRGVEKRG